MDPLFVRIPEIFVLETCALQHTPSLSAIPLCRRRHLCFPVSASGPESAVAVPTIPVCLLNFLLPELLTSASGLSSWAKYSCCLKIHCVAGLWRSGKLCLHAGLLSELSAWMICMQETSKHSINLPVHAPFPGFLVESVHQGKLRHRRHGATSFRPFHLIGMRLFCRGTAWLRQPRQPG